MRSEPGPGKAAARPADGAVCLGHSLPVSVLRGVARFRLLCPVNQRGVADTLVKGSGAKAAPSEMCSECYTNQSFVFDDGIADTYAS
eukprot:g42708.t1